MKTCKVKPDKSTCSACLETQQMFNTVDDCSKCAVNTRVYEIVAFTTGIFGAVYALVLYNDKITQVQVDMCYDIKEVSDGNN